MKPTRDEISALAAQFTPDEITVAPIAFGGGHINDTFLFESGSGLSQQKHVIQHINRTAFHHPEEVMENMQLITDHLRRQCQQRGLDASRETLSLDHTCDGTPYVLDSTGELWRCYRFVDNTVTYDRTEDIDVFRESGSVFGRFQSLLSDFDPQRLHETIPHFHDTPKRFRDFREAVENDAMGRAAEVRAEIEGALGYEPIAPALTSKLEMGLLPLRVTHNDTKLNNVLIDKDTGKGLCAIDLDTVMPGLAAYDFGDAIRFGASTALEDEKDVSKVHFSMALYRAYAEGFLAEVAQSLSDEELRSLPMGAKLMTLECFIRFLGDYLNGDIYFKTDYPTHNLVRARTQWKLLREMDEHWDEMLETVLELGKKADA
ncbi:MAG: aminoglycoside phosphotransferase family protein [Eubacteriales bacterium]|nr:aminoglycoside phosphotransferase family protein [Eubacteriales bacterium]